MLYKACQARFNDLKKGMASIARKVPSEMVFLWTGGYCLLSNYGARYLPPRTIVTDQPGLFFGLRNLDSDFAAADPWALVWAYAH